MISWSRIFLDLIVFIAVVSSPWWFAFLLAAYLFFIFENYAEIIFVGSMFDMLYGFGGVGVPIMTIVSVGSYLVLGVAKRNLRTYV